MSKQVKIYPNQDTNPTIANSDSSKANLGFCFSGGGSRALTCAWGQMLGMDTLNLMDKPRYISSVSGGTWASSIYTFLPETYTDKDLLGTYVAPKNLSLDDEQGTFNINTLSDHSFGNVPAGTNIDDLLTAAGAFIATNGLDNHQWLWANIIGKLVLEHYDLRAEGETSWMSTKSFSLSQEYATANFPQKKPSSDNFFFVRPGRPFIIMNDNIMQKVTSTDGKVKNIVQLPNQLTPVSGGVKGQTPNGQIIGGGQVESYAYASTLDQTSADTSPVDVSVKQPYSLIDIASTSSAFFAQAIASFVQAKVSDTESKEGLVSDIESILTENEKESLLARYGDDVVEVGKEIVDEVVDLADYIGTDSHAAYDNSSKIGIKNAILQSLEDFAGQSLNSLVPLDNIIPRYNYWPIGKNSKNEEMLFTDGGTLDNTGVIGMLSQTDTGANDQEPISLVAFVNTDSPLVIKNNKIISAGQAAPLFGIDFDDDSGEYQPYTETQKDPQHADFDAMSLIAVFANPADNNGETVFDKLVKGLYATNCGANAGEQPDDDKTGSAPAFHQMELTTIANPLANISAGRSVKMLYLQNAKMLDWQNSIGDNTLKSEIIVGQNQPQTELWNYISDGVRFLEFYYKDKKSFKKATADILKKPACAFDNFPYYSTFTKIGLEAKESNALSQMWAWAIADDASALKKELSDFIASA